jgi:hypothetical protein
MENWTGIDWCDYFGHLTDDQMRELATWLAADFLKVSEFTDIVDRVYAQAPDEWHGRLAAFMTGYGLPLVHWYACRKRRFAELMAALEDAYMSGAFPGDVAPQELQPLPLSMTAPRSVEDLLGVLEHVRSGPG